MDNQEFRHFRKKLGKTQKQMAQLLGVSLKAVHSYEQGWRKVPGHVERQVFFLVSRLAQIREKRKNCWEIKNCPPDRRKACVSWQFQAGKLCWFINGTICHGDPQKNWDEKMKLCRSCEVLTSLL